MPEINAAPETKAQMPSGGSPTGEVALAFGDFMHAFEGFREANDERLRQLERRMSADVLSEEKVERLNQAVDAQERRLEQLVLKQMRPALGGGGEMAAARPSEHRQAFEAYVRGGDEGRLRRMEAKAMSGLAGTDGGFLVPEETETEIGRRLAAISPIRSIATVRTVSSSLLKKPFAVSGAQTGWVGETAARPETAAPQLAELSFPTMELYAMPAATNALLDDAAVDIDRWLGEEVEQAFAAQESAAFVVGDGVSKPKGFMTYDTVDETAWIWGKVGTVPTGADGAFLAGGAADSLIDLVYALKAGYRQNASFVMNRRSQAAVRKLKDADGNYLWQPPASAGARATLMGFPMVEAEDMPDIAVDANAIAFGDFARFYLIVDRQGVRVLRDPYSAKPYVLFYTTKRVGGGIQDFDAAKFLAFAA
ncbi:phage major capsid protein [Mangrovibrevibacter kandeliae]|uniref:phage major capsid protein n=1 Tax=Mangrovibrevibacter kandeliae TaxID=2968473 RepID=UPI002118ED97|nr:phage major capsid protein [Aurantimonas sp. CSK15Z-1]MCQ8781078.1 phage major capsid protein [Aurantimonas sp. CSK15Z-1]